MDNEFVEGLDRLSDRVAFLRRKLSTTVITQDIGELLLRRMLERFDQEVDPDGKKWKPYAESTLKRRRYAGANGRKMLVRTQLLRDSIQMIKGGLGTAFTNTGAGLRIGIDSTAKTTDGKLVSVYARIQNQHRRFLGISRKDIEEIDAMLRRRANEAME